MMMIALIVVSLFVVSIDSESSQELSASTLYPNINATTTNPRADHALYIVMLKRQIVALEENLDILVRQMAFDQDVDVARLLEDETPTMVESVEDSDSDSDSASSDEEVDEHEIEVTETPKKVEAYRLEADYYSYVPPFSLKNQQELLQQHKMKLKEAKEELASAEQKQADFLQRKRNSRI